MIGEKRAQLIRDRAAKLKLGHTAPVSKPQGMACAAGKPTAQPVRLRYVVYPKPTGRGFVSCGPMQWRDGPKWVKTPDQREEPMFEPKRRQGAPVLAKVAAKAKREKLPRLKLREPWEVRTFQP